MTVFKQYNPTTTQWETILVGNQGPTGPAGPTGATGATGVGVAAGGTANQVLTKVNGTDYNTTWTNNTPADGTVTHAKLNGFTGVTYADVSINTSTTYNWYHIVIPAGKAFSDIVSVVPYGGVNDIVYYYGTALGHWSGVQDPYSIRVLCHLGNGVASPWSTIRIYFRSV